MDRPELTRLLGHVSSSVGHQVINSLSTIVSQTEILRTLIDAAGAGSPEVGDRVETIIRVALDASTMTRRLLGLSHDLTSIEPSKGDDSLQELDLGVLAADFARLQGATIAPTVEWVLDASPTSRITGDPAAIGTVLRLIAENAVEALPGGKGTITLTVRPGSRDWTSLELRDNGGGMSPEILDRAAEPFFSTKEGHRGLGLTIARGIWRRHRGSLVIESQPGEGTTVRLTVPPSTGT
jgi:signal transduction histidine kinase